MGNLCSSGSERREAFKWRVTGFSSLLPLGARMYRSSNHEEGGYVWRLLMIPKLDHHGESRVGLYLELDPSSLASDVVLKAVYKLYFYNQLQPEKSKISEMCDFLTTSKNLSQKRSIVPLRTFHDQNSGFVVHDCCIFGVEIMELRPRILKPVQVSDWLSVQKKIAPLVVKWEIKNFTELKGPCSSSQDFTLGGHKWHLSIYLDQCRKNKHLGVYLNSADPTTLPTKQSLYVDFSICVIDQVGGKHRESKAHCKFHSKCRSLGWPRLLSLEDFNDASKGFLVNGTCVVEATISILGSCKIQDPRI